MEPQTSKRDPLQEASSVYSIPTAYPIDRIEKSVREGDLASPKVTVAISIATLIRNWQSTEREMSHAHVMQRVKREIGYMIDELADLFSHHKMELTLCFYAYETFKAIPKVNARNPTPPRAKLNDCVKIAVNNKMTLISPEHLKRPDVKVVLDVFSGANGYTRALSSFIKGAGRTTSVIMISHCPIDFHVGYRNKDFRLLQSHTGTIITYSGLNSKVLGSPDVPFYPIAHSILGDKDYIKSTLSRKEKKTLLTAASKDRWIFKTQDSIKIELRKLGLLPHISMKL